MGQLVGAFLGHCHFHSHPKSRRNVLCAADRRKIGRSASNDRDRFHFCLGSAHWWIARADARRPSNGHNQSASRPVCVGFAPARTRARPDQKQSSRAGNGTYVKVLGETKNALGLVAFCETPKHKDKISERIISVRS